MSSRSLDDERDQASVLEGVPDARSLGVLIKNLEAKKQVLLTGYALPMPIVVETRDYYAFAKSMRGAAVQRRDNGTDVDLWER